MITEIKHGTSEEGGEEPSWSAAEMSTVGLHGACAPAYSSAGKISHPYYNPS